MTKVISTKRAELDHSTDFDDEGWAKGYYGRHRKWAIRSAKEVVDRLTKLGFTEGRILDAGCGFGLMALEIARAFPRAMVVGIDLSDPLLRIARDLTKEAGMTGQVRFEKQDVTRMDLPDDSFDVVLNIYVFHLVEGPSAMVNEIERVLAPKGILLLKDLKRSWLGHFDNAIGTSYTKDEAEEILRGSRLRAWTLKSSIMHLEVETIS